MKAGLFCVILACMQIDVLERLLDEHKQPAWRLKQIKQAYYHDLVGSWDDVSTLPKELRPVLAKIAWDTVKPAVLLNSKSRTSHKALFELADGKFIESVLMVYEGRLTACVSSQVGCNMGCTFCATGRGGFSRNLSPEEIVDQVVFWSRFTKEKLPEREPERVTNVVFMGMGEPFNNWTNVWQAIQTMNSPEGLNIAQRKISVSTVGIVPGINKFADIDTQVNLAISLHAPNEELRSAMMPVNRLHSLKTLMSACLKYVAKTNRKLFFEYVMIDGKNDSPECAKQLADLMLGTHLYHVNLIPMNPVDADLQASSSQHLRAFTDVLDKYKVPFTIRQNIGQDIEAACGQLSLKHIKQQKIAFASGAPKLVAFGAPSKAS